MIIDFLTKTVYTNKFQYFTYEALDEVEVYFGEIEIDSELYYKISDLREYGFQIFNVDLYPQTKKFKDLIRQDQDINNFLNQFAEDIVTFL